MRLVRAGRRGFFAASLLMAAACICDRSLEAGIYFDLGPAAGYNTFVFGNANLSYSDIEGRTAVGGNLDLKGYTVALKAPSSTTPNIVVGGNLTMNGGDLRAATIVGGNADIISAGVYGNLYVNGNVNLNNMSLYGELTYKGTFTHPSWLNPTSHPNVTTPLPIDFAAAAAYLKSQSSYLGGLSPTGTDGPQYSSLLLKNTTPGDVAVFDITASQLAGRSEVLLQALANQMVVINVHGTDVTFPNFGFQFGSTNKQEVLWNFVDATSLKLDGSFVGSILAPLADVKLAWGNIDGTIIAKSLTGSTQMNNYPFINDLNPPVTTTAVSTPEPSSLLIFSVLALGMPLMRRRGASAISSNASAA